MHSGDAQNGDVRSPDPAAARLQAILDALTEAVFVVDRRDVVTASNVAAHRLVAGFATADRPVDLAEPGVLGSAFALHRLDGTPVVGDERPRVRALRGDHVEGMLLLLRQRGRPDELVVEVSTAPVPGPRGQVEEVVLAFREVGRHLAVQRDLALARHQLEEAVEAGGVGLWDRDLVTGQVSYSLEWKRQIGYLAHEVGDDVEEFRSRVHPDDLERVERDDAELRLGLRRRNESTFRFRHRDGSYRHILARASLVTDETGRPVRLVGNHIDITERVAMEQRLAQANRLEGVGRLAGGIAHEFNNLLAAVGLSIEVAAGEVAQADAAARLRQVRELIEQGKHLTRQLLALSHAPVLEAVVLDLHEQVAGMRDTLDRLLGEAVTVEVRRRAARARVRMDRGQLQQVLLNLAINARDAMPAGGVLSLEVLERAGADGTAGVVLQVRDTGHGMDPATLEQAVDPLFTTKPAGRGTGLGLALVHSVVEKSGGRLTISSEPGAGTTVEVWLPLVEAPVPEPPAPAGPPGGASGAGRCVLVVEDDADLREAACAVLRRAGYRVLAAGSAAQARSVVEEAAQGGTCGGGRPEAVVCDLVLPDGHGSALVDRLRERLPGVRVLLMSGYTDDPAAGEAVGADRLAFLAKPFTSEQLLAALERTLA